METFCGRGGAVEDDQKGEDKRMLSFQESL